MKFDYILSYNNEDVDEFNIIVDDFLTMMIELRDVLLQNATLLIQMYSHNSLFHHRVFKHSIWVFFVLTVQTVESRMKESIDIQLQKIVLVVVERIHTMQKSVIENIQLLNNTLNDELEKVTSLLKNLMNDRIRFIECFDTINQFMSTFFVLSQSASEFSKDNLFDIDSTSHFVLVRFSLVVFSNTSVYILNFEIYIVTNLWRKWHSDIEKELSIVSLNEKHDKIWRARYNVDHVKDLKYESISNNQIMYKISRRSLKSTVSADDYIVTSVVANPKTNLNHVNSQVVLWQIRFCDIIDVSF